MAYAFVCPGAAAAPCSTAAANTSGASYDVVRYHLEVVKEYPHDVTSYTQGLFFHDGQLYESTGQYGLSTMRKVDLATGKALKRLDFGSKYFAEGSVILGDRLYILTWKNRQIFVYGASDFKYVGAWSYPRDGWGLTTDGRSLIASDGSDCIYFLDSSFKLQRTLRVTMNGSPLRYINEMEWIDGRIWANIYTRDFIVIINPENGCVEGYVNCRGLLPDKLRKADTDVLNGIAWLRDGEGTRTPTSPAASSGWKSSVSSPSGALPSGGRLFLTGKNWPRLYEVHVVPDAK